MSRKGAGTKKGAEEERDVLQAVILTDSYQSRFKPLTLERPRCLLPLANTPLIEYTFEFLAQAGVENVYVYCSTHVTQIEEHIKKSKWSRPYSSFRKLEIIVSTNSASVGDALRELDAKQIFTSDFLLVTGDIVSNLNLTSIVEDHKKRRAADKNAIMTMILRQASPRHRTNSKQEQGIFYIEPKTMKCVYYTNFRNRRFYTPPEIFNTYKELEIRIDLIDCQVDICSPDVLALFTENFDYQEIRRHFVHGILQDYELYGKAIHCHIAMENYAARVKNLQTYNAISKDIVARWAYPVCPDSNYYEGHNYHYERGNIYKEENIVLGRSCLIKHGTVIGGDTNIGEGTVIGNSIIGKNCAIGKNVTIDGSYIWNNVRIENGSTVKDSIVADNSVIGEGSTINSGSIISYRVKLAPKTVIPKGSKITAFRKMDSDDEEDAEDNVSDIIDPGVVGKGGIGVMYEESESEDEEETNKKPDGLVIEEEDDDYGSDSSISCLSESEDESSPQATQKSRRTSGSFATSGSEESEADQWHREAVNSLRNALDHNHPVEVASLELNGLRMSADASWEQVRRAAAAAFVGRISELVEKEGQAAGVACLSVLKAWKDLINRMIHDQSDQVSFLLLVQKELAGKAKGETVLLHFAKNLYDLDVMEEEGVLAWWGDERSKKGEAMVKVRAQTKQFVDWLEDAEEEGEDEEEDEDSE